MYYYGRDKRRRLRRRIRLVITSLAALGAIIGLYFLFSGNKSVAKSEPEDLMVQEYTSSLDTIKTPRKEVMIQSQRPRVAYYASKVGNATAAPANDNGRLSSTTENHTVLSSSVKPERKSTGPVYEVVSVAHFYNQPRLQSRRKDLINYWNETYGSIKPITKRNGFIYVVFKYPQGKVVKGWLREKDLKEVNTAYGNNKD